MEHTKKRLINKLIVPFSLLSISAILVVSAGAYLFAKKSIERSLFARLNVAITAKDAQIDRWFQTQRQDMLLLASLPDTLELSRLLLADRNSAQPNPNRTNALRGRIATYFGEIGEKKSALKNISILTAGGIVLFSTNEKLENMYQPLGSTTTYFTEDRVDIDPTLHVSSTDNAAAIAFAVPILDSTNKRIAVLSATLDLSQIDKLIRTASGLGETGQTYLIGRLEQKSVFVGAETASAAQYENGVRSVAIDAAVRGQSGSGLYQNYAGDSVIGAYGWLDKHNLALIAEIGRGEAFAPARTLARNIALTGTAAAGILLLGIYLALRRLTKPIATIAAAAMQFEKGNLSSRAIVEGEDEIGTLARTFNRMAQWIEKERKKGRKASSASIKDAAKAGPSAARKQTPRSKSEASDQNTSETTSKPAASTSSDLIGERYRITQSKPIDALRNILLAKDTRYLNEPTCAIEQFHIPLEPKFAEAVRTLFEAEAPALEAMGRSEVAPRLLAFFEESRSLYVIVREFFEGNTLEEKFSQGQPLNLTESLELLISLLRLLEIVHLGGLAHQDIQPKTIIFHPQKRRYVLVNLGLRARIQARIDSLQGKPYSFPQEYAAPEQKLGQALPESDLYALGLITLQALTGKGPQELSLDPNTGEIAWRNLLTINTSFASVLERLLCQDYRKRYAKVRDVLADLNGSSEIRSILALSKARPQPNSTTN